MFIRISKLKQMGVAGALVLASVITANSEMLSSSDDRLLTESDIAGMNEAQLRIVRNEIYARHGYSFKSNDLRAHFSKYSWYVPRQTNVSLSKIEQRNVAFIQKYEKSPALLTKLDSIASDSSAVEEVKAVQLENSKSIEQLQSDHIAFQRQLVALKSLVASNASAGQSQSFPQAQSIANNEIDRILAAVQTKLASIGNEASIKYGTSIKPEVSMTTLSPRELSKSFPKVPWYKPAFSSTFGEFWIEPVVNDTGELEYTVKFIDPNADNERVSASFSLNGDEARAITDGLKKAVQWASVAEQNNVRKIYMKTSSCTPEVQCSEKIPGNTSTQIDFLIFEDGATGVRIIRNKGAYQDNYGMSIGSAALLASYFDYMIATGEDDLTAGSQTVEDIDSLFE